MGWCRVGLDWVELGGDVDSVSRGSGEMRRGKGEWRGEGRGGKVEWSGEGRGREGKGSGGK